VGVTGTRCFRTFDEYRSESRAAYLSAADRRAAMRQRAGNENKHSVEQIDGFSVEI